MTVANKGTESLTWEKVIFKYSVNGQNDSKSFPVSKTIQASKAAAWQNSREYHKEGDVLYFNAGIPSSLTIEFYFKNFAAPVKVVKTLKPYGKSFSLPFKAADLKQEEMWVSGSTHGGGSQVFAYDMGVSGYANGAWSRNLPGKDGSQNNHSRVWGKRIYAMADGVVVRFTNDMAENPKPGERAPDTGGGGNSFVITHGDLEALYAHMQKGSLNPKLMKEGAIVKEGDFLGLAGNSGSSSGPHLHVHVTKSDGVGGFRPLLFRDGYTIGGKFYTEPLSNKKWSELSSSGIPGFEGNRSYISPGDVHPYCAYSTNLKQIGKHGIPAEKYQEEFDKIYTCGFYPVWIDGYDVNDKTYFNVIFKPIPTGMLWAAKHGLTGEKYQEEVDKWKGQGYKLTFVDSYLQNGSVRYAAVWVKSNAQITAYHGAGEDWHQNKFEELSKEGWVPVNVSCVSVNGQRKVTALYEKKNVGGAKLKSSMTLQEYKNIFEDYNKEGYKLVYLNAYNHDNSARLSGIWYKNPSFDAYVAKHQLTSAAYQEEYEERKKAGWLTQCVTGYENGGMKFEGVWIK